jgi:hypothetical protein
MMFPHKMEAEQSFEWTRLRKKRLDRGGCGGGKENT